MTERKDIWDLPDSELTPTERFMIGMIRASSQRVYERHSEAIKRGIQAKKTQTKKGRAV